MFDVAGLSLSSVAAAAAAHEMEMGANGMHGTRLSQCAGPAPRARPDKRGPLGVPPHQSMEGEVCSLKSFGGEPRSINSGMTNHCCNQHQISMAAAEAIESEKTHSLRTALLYR